MGDVAMTVPVLKNALHQNPSLQITVVSNAFLQPLFEGLERCHFHPAHLKEKHKGAAGMYRLYKELKAAHQLDAVADLHDVLRSKLLRSFFKLGGIATASIDKGRKEKKALTQKENKIFQQLSSTHERYAQVLRAVGIKVELKNDVPVYPKQTLPLPLPSIAPGGKKIIGIAPFAQHAEKMYPIEKMKTVVKTLASQNNTIFLFGGGASEAATLQQWENEMPSVYNMAGKYSFKEELAIISNLHVMVSMDSANMHLASLYAVPVVSVWGATHPFAGFYGWGQPLENIVSVELSCRPCSVFGNKPCWRGDHACMMQIGEEMIIDKIINLKESLLFG
jgi:ADP-heptose:LPS heptosyltransferase